MPHVRARDGTRLYYEHFPTQPARPGAPTVLLLIGLGMRGRVWGEATSFLTSHGYAVVTMDNRGVGASDTPKRPFSTATMAQDALDVLAGLGVERAHVVGASLGGMVAQEMALRQPERLAALVLLSTSGGLPRLDFVPPAALLGLVALLLARVRDEAPEQRLRRGLRLVTSAEYAERVDLEDPHLQLLMAGLGDRFSPRGYLFQLLAATAHSSWSRLGELAVPTLVQHGEDDQLITVGAARALAAGIPGARLDLYSDAAHLVPLQRPDSLEALVGFLREHDGRAALERQAA